MNPTPEKIERLRNLSKQARRYRRGLYGQNCPENLKAVRDEVKRVLKERALMVWEEVQCG